jgi:hypothetical protein
MDLINLKNYWKVIHEQKKIHRACYRRAIVKEYTILNVLGMRKIQIEIIKANVFEEVIEEISMHLEDFDECNYY